MYKLDQLREAGKARYTCEESQLLDMYNRITSVTPVLLDGPSFLRVCMTGK